MLVVQRCQEPLGNVDRHEVVRRHDHVIRRAAGLDLGQELFITWYGVVRYLDPKFLFKLWNSTGVDVVLPVVDEQPVTLALDALQHLRCWACLGSYLAAKEPHNVSQQRRRHTQLYTTLEKSTPRHPILPQRLDTG